MSDVVCCPLSSGGDGDDRPSASFKSNPKSRKPHRCYECREWIPEGVHYENFTGIWDGKPNRYKTCASCVEIRDHFACDGFLFGQLWDDLESNFFPDMKAGGPCMQGLSPSAKSRLFELRLAWLERSQ